MERDVVLSLLWMAIVLVFSSSAVSGQKLDDSDIIAKIDDFVREGMSCHNNPGLSISVVRGGKVLLAKGYGFKSVHGAERHPVTGRTLFGIASLSKGFAAAILLRVLEDYTNITLSTTVRDVLGDDNVFYGYLRSRYATLEDLLAHRLGIPGNNNIRLDDSLTRKTLAKRLRYLKPVGGFRTSFYYNNLVYGLATYITEKLGGQKWEDLVHSKLFVPLGMTSSTFTTTADPASLDLATGYTDVDGDLLPVPFEFSRRWGELCGSGCVLSSAEDMTRWMMFHLEGGRNKRNQQVLQRDSLEECQKPQNAIPSSTVAKYYIRPLTPVTVSQDSYGLGWKLGYYRGYRMLQHSGSTFGYRALLTLLPGLDAGIFTVLTGDDPAYLFRTNIHNYVADLLIGTEPWLNGTTVCSFPLPWQPPRTSSSRYVLRKDLPATRSLTEYTGVYRNAGYGQLSVFVNRSTDVLSVKYGFAQFELYPKTKADQFFALSVELMANVRNYTTFRFEADKNDTIQTLVIPSFESKVPPVFNKIKPTASNITQSNEATRLTSHALTLIAFIMATTCLY